VPDEDGYFGEEAAARYDESSAEMFDAGVVEPTVDFLADVAGDARAPELGIGTGRWSDWRRAPYASESGKHISVWEKR
jgi:hypothetical protein